MTYIRWAVFIWAMMIAVLLSLAVKTKHVPVTHAKTFCAYGKVFVEFDEEGKRWGTLMLDWYGKPIPCKEEDEQEPANLYKI